MALAFNMMLFGYLKMKIAPECHVVVWINMHACILHLIHKLIRNLIVNIFYLAYSLLSGQSSPFCSHPEVSGYDVECRHTSATYNDICCICIHQIRRSLKIKILRF